MAKILSKIKYSGPYALYLMQQRFNITCRKGEEQKWKKYTVLKEGLYS